MGLCDVTSIDHFNSLVKDSPIIIFDFWAEWCMPCMEFLPIFSKFAKLYDSLIEFAKINIDDFEEITEKFDLNVFPSYLIFVDNILVLKRETLLTEGQFAQIMQSLSTNQPINEEFL